MTNFCFLRNDEKTIAHYHPNDLTKKKNNNFFFNSLLLHEVFRYFLNKYIFLINQSTDLEQLLEFGRKI